MKSPRLDPDLVALVDQEGADLRDFLDANPRYVEGLDQAQAEFGRLIAIDCLSFSREPIRLLTRLLAWDAWLMARDA